MRRQVVLPEPDGPSMVKTAVANLRIDRIDSLDLPKARDLLEDDGDQVGAQDYPFGIMTCFVIW